MKKTFWSQFFLRGLIAAGGGPVVLSIIFGILGKTGVVSTIAVSELCLGILTVTLLAFIVGGMTAIYQLERLPLLSAILIHGGVLYITYLLIYLINGWLLSRLLPILVFTGVFIVGYAIIWCFIYLYHKNKTDSINKKLKT